VRSYRGEVPVPELYYDEPVVPVLRRFVEDFRTVVAREGGTPGILPALRGPAETLLRDPSWITGAQRQPIPGATATYALYRSRDPDLCVFTMVVAPGEMTKVHNHLTDGWVGLVQGEQLERKFRRRDDAGRVGYAELDLVAEERIPLGGLTPIRHPDEDIHQILTLSPDASVSLHLLCSDLGTVARQAFDPDAHEVTTFVSGYTNVDGVTRIGQEAR
jgi:3-mercaptopropionate dioxygenase